MISNRDEPHPLTDLGREQAAALADAVRGEGVQRILSSPIPRAHETAEIVGRALGVPVETASALREFDCGEYEGRSDDAAWAAHAAVVHEWLELGNADARLPGGESLSDMRARFEPFLATTIAELLAGHDRAAGHTDRATLLVSHGGFLRCVLPSLLDQEGAAAARDRYLGNAEFIRADVRADGTIVGRRVAPSR